jgi:hypothetical protein
MATPFEEQLEAMERERARQDEQLARIQAALHRVAGQRVRLSSDLVNALEARARRAEQAGAAEAIPTGALRA